jgi:hypothetical protein
MLLSDVSPAHELWTNGVGDDRRARLRSLRSENNSIEPQGAQGAQGDRFCTIIAVDHVQQF